MTTIEMTCHCGKRYRARVADVNRGWGKSCSKRCAAIKRTKSERAGNHKRAKASTRYPDRKRDYEFGGRIWNDDFDPSWDSHK